MPKAVVKTPEQIYFVDYVYNFYDELYADEWGYTEKMVFNKENIGRMMNFMENHKDIEVGYDSIDRERVRDLILEGTAGCIQ